MQYWYKGIRQEERIHDKEGLIDEANPLFVVLMATGRNLPAYQILKSDMQRSPIVFYWKRGESPYKHGKFPLGA